MTPCRVCGADCGDPAYQAGAPAVTSLSTLLDATTTCHICAACGHAQSPDMADLQAFYDTEYKISLASDDHDQLYEVRGDQPIYRTEKQAELVLALANPPQSGQVLDYGAAKAATLQAVLAQRPDIQPHVFDVSEDYRSHWDEWVRPDAQATYRCPDEWDGKFDLIMSHFVLEHVGDPIAVLADIARLLAPGGQAFISVPDVVGNPGDMLVVDHVNHFTRASIHMAFARANLSVEEIHADAFRGAFVIVAQKGRGRSIDPGETVAELGRIADFWSGARDRLLAAAALHGERPAAIYGAGFYGVFINAVLRDRQRIVGHLDRNPHVREAAPVAPVFDPMDAPEGIEVLYAGLNPRIARRILTDWQDQIGRTFETIYLDPVE